MQRAGEVRLSSTSAWARYVQPLKSRDPVVVVGTPLAKRHAPSDVEGTRPKPLVDLSGFHFTTLTRPDGRTLQMEIWGELVIPDLLSPGGVEMEPLIIDGPQVRLQCFGDSGKGTPAQFAVAANIVAMANERDVHATMHLGDIIYPSGILKPDDPRIDALYIKPYGELRNPHAVFGNHEYGNTLIAGVPEAWLAAAKIGTPGMFAMPARYYSRLIVVDDMIIRCLCIDSSTLAVDPLQVAWLERELEKGADHKLVFGHHTIYSGGLHGTLPHLEKVLLPLLEKHADLYVSGHDHNLQFLRSDSGFPLVVSGGAGENRLAWKTGNRSKFFSSTMGTTFVSIDKNGIDIEIVSGYTRKVLFTKHLDAKKPQ